MFSTSRILRLFNTKHVISSLSSNNLLKNINYVSNVDLATRSFTSIFSNKLYILEFYTPSVSCSRPYAKGKNIKKDKVKGKVAIDENIISELVNVESVKNQMENAVEQLKDDFTKQLSLRSTIGSIESLLVSVDGNEHTLQELAQIVRKNPKTMVINMAMFPQAIPAALKAIEKSGMNLNPQQDGTTLYIPVPKVTKEHRESLAKNAKQIFIKCKTAIRDVQIKYIKQIKKKDKVAEDLARNVEQQLIAIADSYISAAEKILETKQNELIGNKD